MSDEIILPSSESAAELVTLTVWKSRNGKAFSTENPNAEKMARWEGATHVKCTECGEPSKKPYTACEKCRGKLSRKRYFELPLVDWDGKTPLTLWNDDKFFFDESDIDEYLEDNDLRDEDLMLVVCEGNHLHEVELDYWSDDWPEDGDPPEVFLEKLDELNKHIRSMGPVSWSEGKKRVIYRALPY